MKSLAIFYHLGQYGTNWKLTYQQQMNSLLVSGLLKNSKLFIGVNGSVEPLKYIPKNAEVVYHPQNNYENDTLKLLRDYSKENLNSSVLYFHNKGCTHSHRDYMMYVDGWRLFMEYHVIFRWKDCLEYLEKWDCVGTNWSESPSPHFSGNFWWANCEYINKLNHAMLDSNHRPDEEMWIGSASVKYPKDIHNSGLPLGGHCTQFYPEEKYVL